MLILTIAIPALCHAGDDQRHLVELLHGRIRRLVGQERG
jgi:hypothetical protein